MIDLKKYIKESLLDDEEDLIDRVNTKFLVEEWLKKYNVKNYRLQERSDGFFEINVKGSVRIWGLMEDFPEYIKFGRVTGNFSISDSSLTSFEGFPRSVGILKISNCKLPDTLEGISKEITGELQLGTLDIKSLKGLPDKIKKVTIGYCSKLISLEGLPKTITSLELYSCFSLISLEGCPSNINDLTINNCPYIISLEGIAKRVNKLELWNLGSEFTADEVKKYCSYKIKRGF